ncbi:recombinase family protein [Micromonospora sp. CA-246542]|uniref:recombinase family protein n=1 Tax=Micromonospora sp. CA-246542 TaxID=3239959 RepID=UPI003D90C4A1
MRVLGAVRLSHLTDETTSPEVQRADISGDPVVVGGTLVDWAEDLDISADKFSPFKRPSLGPWLTDRAKIALYDALVFAKADRAIRSMMDMYELSQWAITHRKVIVFVKGPGGGPRMELDFRKGALDPITQLIVTIFAFAGEIEVNTMKDRAQGSQKLARVQGRWHGGTPPYGYRAVKHPSGKGFILAVDPESSKRVQEIVKRILDGESMNAVCQAFNAAGVLTPSDHYREQVGKKTLGHRWKTTALIPILRGRAILGIAEKDGEVIRGDDGLPVKRAEAIVSRSDYELVQKRLDEISKKKTRSMQTSPLLGVLFCLSCGEPAYRVLTGAATRKVRQTYYRCRGRTEKRNACTAVGIRADALEEIIEATMLGHIGDVEIFEEVFIAAESHQEELAEALAAHEDLVGRSAGKTGKIRENFDRQIASLEALIERLSALPESPARTELRSTGQTYREVWNASDDQGRRKMLLKAGVRVEAAPAGKDGISVGRHERPKRQDEAVNFGEHKNISFAFFIPKGLAERAGVA